MEQRGNEKVVWCFMYVKVTTLTENYKTTYELWRKRSPDLGRNIRRN